MTSRLPVGPARVLVTMGLLGLLPFLVFAKGPNFAGTWNAKYAVIVGPPPTNGVSLGARGRGGGIGISPSLDSSIQFPDAEVGGTGVRGQGTRGVSPGGIANTGKDVSVKITLKVKLDKGKVTGTLTFNESGGGFDFSPAIPQEIHDAAIDGNTLTFRTVSASGATLSSYSAVLTANRLNISRSPKIDKPDIVRFVMMRGR